MFHPIMFKLDTHLDLMMGLVGFDSLPILNLRRSTVYIKISGFNMSSDFLSNKVKMTWKTLHKVPFLIHKLKQYHKHKSMFLSMYEY